MICPSCQTKHLKVRRTYSLRPGLVVQERRCPQCGTSFTTRIQIIQGISPYKLMKHYEADPRAAQEDAAIRPA